MKTENLGEKTENSILLHFDGFCGTWTKCFLGWYMWFKEIHKIVKLVTIPT